ncbi:MAG TPA: hypothetical protein DHL02_25185 [Achromobacter sp.]|nr:hypothetical protein [Achromobacter sp.]
MANAQTSRDTPTIVGVDNFVRAEADLYMAKIVADGSFMPIKPGWNTTIRLYQPDEGILNGSWRFPEPQRVAQ